MPLFIFIFGSYDRTDFTKGILSVFGLCVSILPSLISLFILPVERFKISAAIFCVINPPLSNQNLANSSFLPIFHLPFGENIRFSKKKQIFKFFICKIITLLLYSPPLRSYNSAIALKKTQKNRKDRGKMNVFGLEVTEVTDVKSKKVVYQGVEKTVLYASIQCEGGSFRVQVQDGLKFLSVGLARLSAIAKLTSTRKSLTASRRIISPLLRN